MNKAEKFLVAGIVSACFGCAALTVYHGHQDRKIPPQHISPDTAFCIFDANSRVLKIIETDSQKILEQRRMPNAPFGEPEILLSKNGPLHAIGKSYILNFKAATCTIDNVLEEFVYDLVKAPPFPNPN